jgi:hypothetical protein
MIITPHCPECGSLPDLILADGHQCFCPTEGCRVLTWDSHLSPAELGAVRTEVELDLEGGPDDLRG